MEETSASDLRECRKRGWDQMARLTTELSFSRVVQHASLRQHDAASNPVCQKCIAFVAAGTG